MTRTFEPLLKAEIMEFKNFSSTVVASDLEGCCGNFYFIFLVREGNETSQQFMLIIIQQCVSINHSMMINECSFQLKPGGRSNHWRGISNSEFEQKETKLQFKFRIIYINKVDWKFTVKLIPVGIYLKFQLVELYMIPSNKGNNGLWLYILY